MIMQHNSEYKDYYIRIKSRYECQETGCIVGKTYIFYKNQKRFQEVQVRHDSCWGTPRCVCAVAARAGQDVFTIDFCGGRQYINFPICSENSLKVIKISDKVYEVIFPTGTFAKISLYNYGSDNFYINLEVFPTIADFNETSGLCGLLDNNLTNDLSQRDTKTVDNGRPPDLFSKSWQTKVYEDLLSMSTDVYDKLTPLSLQFYKLCRCNKSDGKGSITCSHKNYDGCTTNERGKEYFCVLHSSSRIKRDLQHIFIFEQHNENNEALKRKKRQTITEVEAFNVCHQAFQQSTYYYSCLQNVPEFGNETLVNCITDLMLTGDKSLTQLHLDTALGQCQAYIFLNSTFQDENPDITTVITNLCSNNCSDRGACSEGKCTCEYGYGGSDCSFDVLYPPKINRLSDDGICDKSEEPCDDITLYGYYFLENMVTLCNFIREEINGSNTVLSTASYSSKLEERTLFEGYCSLQFNSVSSWITKFQFNLSNDGNHFSENYSVYIYNSNCQTFHNDSGDIYFTLQSEYCFISGSCIQSGTFQSNDSCWQCIPLADEYDWTWACTLTNTSNTSTTHRTETITTPSVKISSSSDPFTSDKQEESISTTLQSSSVSSTHSMITSASSNRSTLSTNHADLSPSSTVPSTTLADESDKKKVQNNQDDELTSGIIGLIIAVSIVVIVILATAIFMMKKWIQRKQKETTPVSSNKEGDVCNFPETNRHMSAKGSFNPDNLLDFESPSDKFSRPPSAASTRPMPPTNDLSRIYDQKHIDQLFGVTK